jgi:cell division septation protein DedD
MEKTYFEFKITFLHIVVFLVAVIAIGIFLFYMGYQAGQRRSDPRTAIANEQEQEDAAGNGELSVVDESPIRSAPARPAPRQQSIPDEIKLHEEQGAKKTVAVESRPAPAISPAAETNYTIQVGAFADFANAQRCSRRFTGLGYPTAIITDNQRKLHTVQVGSFASLAEAQKEKISLENREKAKFTIKKSR